MGYVLIKYYNSNRNTDIIYDISLSITWSRGSRLSGSRTRNFSVESPYVNKTKLNMILDVIKCKFRNSNVSSEDIQALLEKSFSCYYPKDGVACGECGSCCLRNSAFNRSKK